MLRTSGAIDVETVALNEGWGKKGKPLNMIPMGMGKKQMGLHRHLLEQPLTQDP